MSSDKEIQALKKQNRILIAIGGALAVGLITILMTNSKGFNSAADGEENILLERAKSGDNGIVLSAPVTREECESVGLEMTPEQVIEVLGEPFQSSKSLSSGFEFEYWDYGEKSAYNIRLDCKIGFMNGVVSSINS